MTVDELTFMLERLADAGCSTEQLVAAARAARDWRIERKALLAVKRALAADTESYFQPANPGSESVIAGPHPDSRKATARKALLVTARLKPCARRVGAALVERYNLGSGRCDAAVQTLADDAGYDLRSARRAIGELVKAGLFVRALQVGRGHANSYTPQWEALAALVRETEGANADSQNRTLGQNPDGRVRQNHIRDSYAPSGGGGRHRAREPNGQLSLRVFGTIDGGRAGLAERRHKAAAGVELALRGKYRRQDERQTMLAAFAGLDGDMLDIIADAEIAARGEGLRAFEGWLRSHTGQGPPRAAEGG